MYMFMIKAIGMFVLMVGLVLIGLCVGVARAEAPTQEPVVPAKPESIYSIIYNESKKLGVDPEKVIKTIECESSFNPNALGDGGKSRGIAQIHSRWHPNVTDAQAYDPVWSALWTVKRFSQGYAREWTCYRELFME